MGLFRARGRLIGPTGYSEDVELLVDTGATLLVVPRPLAEVSLALSGLDVTTPCFIAPDGPALLGPVALESPFLAVAPVAKRLIPVEGFVG